MRIVFAVWILLVAEFVSAQSIEHCLHDLIATAPPETKVADLLEQCRQLENGTVYPERLLKEKASENNRFVITPHRRNYILPFSYNTKPNQTPWKAQEVYPGVDEPVEEQEAKLQLSFKVPLSYIDLLTENDGIYFGFTLKSFWQVYNSELSAPFRETNYLPEIFYQAPIPVDGLEGILFARVGFEHQSNGRSQLLSRSWNRLYVGLGYHKENWGVYLQPWYRIPEDSKVDDGDPATPPPPEGDDNPDIDDFLGHYQLTGAYSYEQMEFSGAARYNFAEGNGAFEVGVSFPLWGRLRGYVQYHNGYGESLIDYNYQTERIGVGFLLTDLL